MGLDALTTIEYQLMIMLIAIGWFQILAGNSNPWLAVTQQLDHPIVADKIRFLPYSHHPRTTCMRVEIYGCPWRGHYLITLSTTPIIIHLYLNKNPLKPNQ